MHNYSKSNVGQVWKPDKLRHIKVMIVIGVFFLFGWGGIDFSTLALAQGNEPSDNCVACHTNQEKLQSLVNEDEVSPTLNIFSGDLPPLETWEKYFIPDVGVLGMHNVRGCVNCHAGVGGTDDFTEAHTDLIKSPSATPIESCGDCHPKITDVTGSSSHFNVAGMTNALTARGANLANPNMFRAFDGKFNADCGQCHVSRPDSMGGGLIKGHEFFINTPEDMVCESCHGSVVVAEYKGQNEGVLPDVHWSQAEMDCNSCHKIGEMHGDGQTYTNSRESVLNCTDCHDLTDSDVEQHQIHEEVACQVCHSAGAYTNCSGCHVSDEEGMTLDSMQLDFKIGLNANPTEKHPWTYQLVRHVPVTTDTFAAYGNNLLPDFDNVPTWKGTSPHNIQKITPQNETCGNCHSEPDLFLQPKDIAQAEVTSNAKVVVSRLPKMAGELGQAEAASIVHPLEGYSNCTSCHQVGVPNPIPHTLKNMSDCFFCHQNGIGAPKFPGGHNDFAVDDCQLCHELAEDAKEIPVNPTATPDVEITPIVPETTTIRYKLSEDEMASVECYECHQTEVEEWAMSNHSVAAKNENFLQVWEKEEYFGECLRCHTTGYDKDSGEYAFANVDCVACHNNLVEGHGENDDTTMSIPVDQSVCIDCHEFTHNEWRIGAHAENNINCINCHERHKPDTRLPKEKLCITCHSDIEDNFTHNTHQTTDCIDCHMPHPDTSIGQIGGTGAVGHSLFVGTETCANCHDEEAHLSREVVATQAAPPEATQVAIEILEDQANLESRVTLLQNSVVSSLGVGLGIGGFLGAVIILGIMTWTGHKED
ncbi:MAG: hypothetical protein B6242_02280 [Anaerolineaceae bacterium 4572_78]|nr:MAG: hypothetical protein B6242_02280 [Anaerolineaceae bacterium 4572_78]